MKKVSLEKLLKEFMPEMPALLNPRVKNGKVFLPIYGEEKSVHHLALKDLAMELWVMPEYRAHFQRNTLPSARESIKEISDTFEDLEEAGKLNVAYCLSHELKIASLAAALALKYKPNKVIEAGCGCGFGAFHYANIMKSRISGTNECDNFLNFFTAVDLDEVAVYFAEDFKGFLAEKEKTPHLEEIEFVHGDIYDVLYSVCAYEQSNLLFSSTAVPEIIQAVIEFSNKVKTPFVISYVREMNLMCKETEGKNIEDLIDSGKYRIRTFTDTEYNRRFNEAQREGILAVPK